MDAKQRSFLDELSRLLLKYEVVVVANGDGERIDFQQDGKSFFKTKLNDPSTLMVQLSSLVHVKARRSGVMFSAKLINGFHPEGAVESMDDIEINKLNEE